MISMAEFAVRAPSAYSNTYSPNTTCGTLGIGSSKSNFGREVSMVKVSVFYPNRPGSHFDMSYYCSNHIPMVQRLLGSTLKSIAVEEGIAGAIPGSPPTYLALGHLYFESVDAFVQAWGPQAQEIVGDVPNYTNCEPIIQISTVKI